MAAVCLGVKVPTSDFLTETRIARINAARYEGQEIAGALHVVRETDRVLEVGAGLGVVGAVIARNARPEKLLSFEANPELIPVITALHRMNGLTERIELRNQVLCAGADRPPTLAFHLRSSFLGSSLLNEGGRPSRVVQVPTADLAGVVEDFQPTVLVMDIEGGELALLDAMELAPFRAIVIEFHPEAYEVSGMRRCKTILRNAGFTKVEQVSTRTVWTCIREDADG
ncbi:MAG: FkbM family methyltransferase [Alphaproteobacteria bacterium MedPE-SWcel]|nr:MAG: FkbM family methyltransferase [Alphaproteobacteria bacterium MedPE-SWcel]